MTNQATIAELIADIVSCVDDAEGAALDAELMCRELVATAQAALPDPRPLRAEYEWAKATNTEAALCQLLQAVGTYLAALPQEQI